jgi:Uma2 family endonuclease
MSALPIVTGITPEEYLKRERAAQFKSEYHAGRMYAMAGTSYRHGLIVGNLAKILGLALDDTPCAIVPGDLRVRVTPEGLYTYPDIVVICGDPKFADDQNDTLLNPTLIIEVLSSSTEALDRGLKAAQYRKIESLQEHVLVSQQEPHVETFRRRKSLEWLLLEQEGLDGVCQLESIGCNLHLADIYKKLKF